MVIRLQSPTIRKFKRGRISGTECIRRRKSDDFFGSDILGFRACGTESILIFCLSFANGLYGSSTDNHRPACPVDLVFSCVTLHELREIPTGMRGERYWRGNILAMQGSFGVFYPQLFITCISLMPFPIASTTVWETSGKEGEEGGL